MEELTLDGVGWTWTAMRSMVWDAEACTLTIAVDNAQVPADQDELREDLEITFTDVSYFKVMREPGWDLDQEEINYLQEAESLPSLGTLDTSLFDKVRAPEVLFGSERAAAFLGPVGSIRTFTMWTNHIDAEWIASGYSIVRLSRRS